MALSSQELSIAYEIACRSEIEALKPGNVHRFADGHRMSADQFLTSARVSSAPLADPKLSVGRRILEAVRATRNAVGTNTNLGILLLCGPLIRAAELDGDLRDNLGRVLDDMDVDDTRAVFAANMLAGLGRLESADENGVRVEPPLMEAMRNAAGRDRIARQYVTRFEDVFGLGLSTLVDAQSRGESDMWPTVRVYMAFLASFPDSHVARKHSCELASAVREEAAAMRASLDTVRDEAERIRRLMAFDGDLKARGINPGTSADLTVACLLVQDLRIKLAQGKGRCLAFNSEERVPSRPSC